MLIGIKYLIGLFTKNNIELDVWERVPIGGEVYLHDNTKAAVVEKEREGCRLSVLTEHNESLNISVIHIK